MSYPIIAARVVLATGRIGLVDAALVRWLLRQRTETKRLLVHVTESVFESLLPKKHIEEFLTALEPIDVVLKDAQDLSEFLHQHRLTSENVKTLLWPEVELLNYSISRICKQLTIREEQAVTIKLTSLTDLRERYSPTPQQRCTKVGLVSGSFDLIHPGHVRLIQAAKQRVDVLVVLMKSTRSIQQQEKNHLGDRPIYSETDRVETLSALRPVDHLVMFNERDCLPSLRTFCPNYFIKSGDDRSRPVVQMEEALVKSLGGETIYLADHHPGYSSTAIIHYVRAQEGLLQQPQ